MAKRVQTTSLQFEVVINGEKKVLKSIKEVKKQRQILQRQVESGTLSVTEYNKKVAELAKLNGILADHRKKIRGISQETKGATKGLANFGKVGRTIQASFGWITVVLGALAGIIALGRQVFREQEALTAVNERINQLTGLQGEALLEATASAQALAKTYEVDVQQAIEAANTATRSFIEEGENMGDVYQRNLDLIAERLSTLGENGDEFLSQIQEYSNQARLAGIESETFFNLVAEGINKGIPTDKLIDSVKEFDIRIKTITKGQKTTLEQVLGKQFSDELIRNVETGAETSFQALQRVSGQILALGEDSAEARKLMSDLFGGPGEDAALFAQIIATTTSNFQDLTGVTSVYSERKREINELEKEAQLALAELNFQLDGSSSAFAKAGIIIRTVFFQAVSKVAEIINNFGGYWNVALQGLKAFVNIGITQFETFLRLALFPVVAIIEKITGEDLRIPRLEVDTEAYDNLQAKIQADREQFAADEQARIAAEESARRAAEERRKAALIQEANEKIRVESKVQEVRRILGNEEIQNKVEIAAKLNADLEKLERESIKKHIKIRLELAQKAADEQLRIQQELEEKRANIRQDLQRQFYRAAVGLAQVANERLFNNRVAKLEEQRDKELALVGNNEKKKRAIEERFEKEKERADKARRNRQKAFEIAQVAINTAQSIVKTGAQLGYPAAIPFQIQAGIIGAIQAATIAAQQFASGGKIQSLADGLITAKPNVSPTRGGDNVLALVKPGEVILNKRQQLALGGNPTFARIGVPGFNDGGAITTPSPETVGNTTQSADTTALLEQLILINTGVRSQQLVALLTQKEAEAISELQTEMAIGRERRSF